MVSGHLCLGIAKSSERSGATVALDVGLDIQSSWQTNLHKIKSCGISNRVCSLISHFFVVDDFGWFWMGSLNKNVPIMLVFPGTILYPTPFPTTHLGQFLMVLSVLLLYLLMIHAFL